MQAIHAQLWMALFVTNLFLDGISLWTSLRSVQIKSVQGLLVHTAIQMMEYTVTVILGQVVILLLAICALQLMESILTR